MLVYRHLFPYCFLYIFFYSPMDLLCINVLGAPVAPDLHVFQRRVDRHRARALRHFQAVNLQRVDGRNPERSLS